MSDYVGVYKGIVVDNADPIGARRVVCKIPQVLGDAVSAWCEPNMSTILVPRIGDLVYIQFADGDVATPLYQPRVAASLEMTPPVLLANSPVEGSIAWKAFSIQYLGVAYAIPAGHTASKYVYWKFNGGNGGPVQFTDDPAVIHALTPDDRMLFLNQFGIPVNVPTASMLPGDLIVPGSISAGSIGAHQVTAQNITLEANYSLIPNSGFDELDKFNPTRPSYWTDSTGSASFVLDAVNRHSKVGFSGKITQHVGAALNPNPEFSTDVSGWSVSGSGTMSWQAGPSGSGRAQVTVPTGAGSVTLSSDPFLVPASSVAHHLSVTAKIQAVVTADTTTSKMVTLQTRFLDVSGNLITTVSKMLAGEGSSDGTSDVYGSLRALVAVPAGTVSAQVQVIIPSDTAASQNHQIDYVRACAGDTYEMVSDRVPVSEGEWVRLSFWAMSDTATVDTLVSALHFWTETNPNKDVGTADFVIDPVTSLTTSDRVADLGFATTWTKYTGSVQIPPGMHFMRLVLGVEPGTLYNQTVTSWFDDGDVTNISTGDIQSSNFQPGVKGWSLNDDGTSQVEDLAVLGNFGATLGSFSQGVQVGDAGVVLSDGSEVGSRLTQVQQSVGQGIVAYANLGSGGWSSAYNSQGFQGLDFTADSSRVYRITSTFPVAALGSGTAAGTYFFTFGVKYTSDGSTPTLSTPNSVGTAEVLLSSSLHGNTPISTEWIGNLPSGPIRLMSFLTGIGSTSSTARIYTTVNAAHTLTVEDLGAGTVTDLGYPNTPSDTTTYNPTPPPKPTRRYTSTFRPNETRSYDSDGTRRTADASNPDMYQGYYSGTHGNTMSCAVYDWNAIASALSGASSVTATLTFRVKHAYLGSGLNVSIHQHNYSGNSTPNVYRPGAEIATKSGCSVGGTYTVNLPASFVSNLRSGTSKGIGFGKPGTNSSAWYGYLYGAGSGSAPVLTISYSK